MTDETRAAWWWLFKFYGTGESIRLGARMKNAAALLILFVLLVAYSCSYQDQIETHWQQEAIK